MAETEVKVQQGKIEAVGKLKEQFAGYSDFIFTDYRGLTVEQITELRHRLREQRSVFKVVKNRYAKIVLQGLKAPDMSAHLTGPTAIALVRDDAASTAKILFDYTKESPLQVKGGLIEGGVYDAKQVEALSKLPSKNVLLAQLMGTMKAPVQNLVFALNGITTKLVRTLVAVADAKKG